MGARLGRIQAALREGAVLFGIMAVNGAVSVTVQQGGHLRGFGEAEGIENAFHKANESLNVGAKFEEAALAAEAISCQQRIEIAVMLDEQMRHGAMPVFIAGWDGENFSFRLSGTHVVVAPSDILDQVTITGERATWTSERGYTYLTFPDPKSPLIGPIATTTLANPKGKGDNGFGLSYPTAKLGFGSSLWAAIEDALRHPEFEVSLIP